MPDKRRHRGRHPDDDRLFATDRHERLRVAVSEYSWLLTRGYAGDAGLKLVGDHYNLTARQRMAVRRSACSDQSLLRRAETMIGATDIDNRPVAIDGYNLLITVESALSGGLILVGRDGCYRDLASVHGTYRKVEETLPALELIVDQLAAQGLRRIEWYLDKPVSNSRRLKALLADLLETRADGSTGDTRWNIALVDSPDTVLTACRDPIVTSDSVILDRCTVWVNLAGQIIKDSVVDAWIVDLRPLPDAT